MNVGKYELFFGKKVELTSFVVGELDDDCPQYSNKLQNFLGFVLQGRHFINRIQAKRSLRYGNQRICKNRAVVAERSRSTITLFLLQ